MTAITFYHSPRSRSTGTLILLEELGAPYALHALDMEAGEQRQPAYLAINPMGKVPAIIADGVLVTEQIAIFIYLADRFAQAGLAPALDSPLRGSYLRWLAFYAGCFEPAISDRALKREAPDAQRMLPYGDYDTTLNTLLAQLAQGPYLLGDTFTAADVLWGTALRWTVHFGVVPESPDVKKYLERFHARPAVQRALAKDVELLAARGS